MFGMSPEKELIFAMVIAYLIGSFPTAVLMSRLFFKRDIRKFGSGNPGATNAWRVFGYKYGIIVILIDLSKGYISARYLASAMGLDPSITTSFVLGFMAVLGHIRSPFTGFKGGKGMSTALGLALAIYPVAALVSLATWGVVFYFSKFASVAAISASVGFPLTIIWLYNPGTIEICLSALLLLILVMSHKSNIKRLRNGREFKLGDNK